MLFCAIIFCVSPEYSEYEIPAQRQPVCGFPDGGNQAETVPATEKTVILDACIFSGPHREHPYFRMENSGFLRIK